MAMIPNARAAVISAFLCPSVFIEVVGIAEGLDDGDTGGSADGGTDGGTDGAGDGKRVD